MSDEVAEKTAKLLMSSDPHEVAAAVKVIEQYNAKASAGAKRLGKGETGVVMGSTAAFPPSPIDLDAPQADIEADVQKSSNVPGDQMIGPDIDAEIEARRNKMQ
jgi:hypothetical protein